MNKKNKLLSLDEANDIAHQFARDLYEYYSNGGDMNNLTASNVYNNSEDDFSSCDSVLKVVEEFNDEESMDILNDMIHGIHINKKEEKYLLEKLKLSNDKESWTKSEKIDYVRVANRLRVIRNKVKGPTSLEEALFGKEK